MAQELKSALPISAPQDREEEAERRLDRELVERMLAGDERAFERFADDCAAAVRAKGGRVASFAYPPGRTAPNSIGAVAVTVGKFVISAARSDSRMRRLA